MVFLSLHVPFSELISFYVNIHRLPNPLLTEE
jgi:hypothetical protein